MPLAQLWSAVACHRFCARGLKCVGASKAGENLCGVSCSENGGQPTRYLNPHADAPITRLN